MHFKHNLFFVFYFLKVWKMIVCSSTRHPHTYWLEIMNNEGRVVVTHHVEIVRESWREKSLVTTVMKYVNCKSKVLPRAGGIISIHLSKKGTFRYT